MVSTIPHRLAILLLAVVASSTVALGAGADPGLPDGMIAVVAEPEAGGPQGSDPSGASAGGELITVFLEEPGEGFSDGGDVPAGMVVGFAQPVGETSGFSDGGDMLEGFITVLAQPAPAGFSDGGDVPEGMIAVRAQLAGFSDGGGGDSLLGLVPVVLEPLSSESSSPPGG